MVEVDDGLLAWVGRGISGINLDRANVLCVLKYLCQRLPQHPRASNSVERFEHPFLNGSDIQVSVGPGDKAQTPLELGHLNRKTIVK